MRKQILAALCIMFAVLLPILAACDDNSGSGGGTDGGTVPQITALSAPVIVLEDDRVSWTAIENADLYCVYVNGVMSSEQADTLYSINVSDTAAYEIYVKAKNSDGAYAESSPSNTVAYMRTVERLDAPVPSAEGNRVFWNAVQNAHGYEVILNGRSAGEILKTEYVFEDGNYGIYRVKVKALSGGVLFKDSVESPEIVCVYKSPALDAPVIALEGKTVNWQAVENAASYEIYIDGETAASTAETSYNVDVFGKHSIEVAAISGGNSFGDSERSNVLEVNFFDINKPFYVSGTNFNCEWVLGLATQGNSNLLAPAQIEILKNADNYVCNMRIYDNLGESALADYAWKLEEVENYTLNGATKTGYPVYRIRLTNGLYLSCVKQDYTGLGREFVCAGEYVENDIGQYWQFIPYGGTENRFIISSVSHNYDWQVIEGHTADYLADTSEANGGPGLYPMNDSKAVWFVWELTNVDAVFDEPVHKDLSGDYTLKNLKTQQIFGFAQGDDFLKAIANAGTEQVMTLEKVEYNGMYNVYRIRFGENKYLYLGRDFKYELKPLDTDVNGSGLGQLFVINEVAGAKGGVNIGHILMGTFTDLADNATRYYAINGSGEYAHREYNALDWRLELGNIWTITKI